MGETSFSDAARARLAMSAAAAEVADRAAALVGTEADELRFEHLAALIERAAGIRDDAEQLLRATVVYARERHLPWSEIGEALGVRRQSAHEQYNPACAEFHDGLMDAEQLPPGADDPAWWVERLDRWCHARADAADQEQALKGSEVPGHVSGNLPAHDTVTLANETLWRANWLVEARRTRRAVPQHVLDEYDAIKTRTVAAARVAIAEDQAAEQTDDQEDQP